MLASWCLNETEPHRLLCATLESMDQGVIMFDARGRVQVFNARAATLLGLRVEDLTDGPEIDELLRRQWHAAEFRPGDEELMRAVRNTNPLEAETCYERRRPDGTVLEVRTRTLKDGGSVRTYTDITQRRASELHHLMTSERLRLALSSSEIGLWDWDLQSDRLWMNEEWCRVVGLDSDGLTMAAWQQRIHPDDVGDILERLFAYLDGSTSTFEKEYRLQQADGSYRWINSRGEIVLRDAKGKPTRVLGIRTNVTERKEAERALKYMALHDALTGLGNRRLLSNRLEATLERVQRTNDEACVFYLDLDRFKTVNDTLGHTAGDLLLREVALRLSAVASPSDTIARIGGDEFVLLRENVDCESFASRLLETLNVPVFIHGREISVGASIGIVRIPRDGTDEHILLRRADRALFRAKEDRNRFRLFDPAMDIAETARRVLELDLRGALPKAEFELHYQPILDTRTEQICTYEALIRWRHPTRGLLSPAHFMDVVEDIGLSGAVGTFVIREACRQASSWTGGTRVAVNVSPSQFRQEDFVSSLKEILLETGLSPGRLEIEVTENVLLRDVNEASRIFDELRETGIRIALDDFGTGYSSLSYLHRFRFDKIKIDRSFIQTMDDPDTFAIVHAIIDIGRRKGCRLTAEGIESPKQFATIRSCGCDEAQGFLIGHPAPLARPESMTRLLPRDSLRVSP